MNLLLLKRFRDTGAETFGRLYNEQLELLMHTLELPWRDNQRKISCIPTGLYLCTPETHPIHGKCFRLFDEHDEVRDRDGVLVHKLNNRYETEGCIGVGMDLMLTNIVWHPGQPACPGVSQSQKAMDMLYALYPEGFDLKIMEAFDEQA